MNGQQSISPQPQHANHSGPPLRVLLVVESSGGGTGRHVMDLAQGLIARGCDVHLLYSTNRIDDIFRQRLAALPALHSKVVPMRTAVHPADFAAVLEVRRYFRAAGPFDLIHGHSSKGGAVARLAAMLVRAPSFYTLHGLIMMDPDLGALKHLIYLNIERVLGFFTARIIAVSPEESRAAKAMKIAATRVSLVPNGIGKLDLAPSQHARAAMDVPPDAVVIGFVGRLVSQKAPEILLRAFAVASADAPHAYLAMIGSGPMEKELLDLTAELGITDKVRWLGHRDAREFLAGFDIFALASRKEGLPYVVLEAMAAGLPIVAASTAGVESLVHNNQNGLVVPPDDPAALAKAFSALLASAQLRANFGQASLQRVARFTVDNMVDGVLRTYRAGFQASDEASTDWEEEPAGEAT